MQQLEHFPVLSICGFSNSGKTTLIKELMPRIHEMGLKTAVVKSSSHDVNPDKEGKDSDILFKAGCDVFIRSEESSFQRKNSANELSDTVLQLVPDYDLILIEGHKHNEISRKFWLARNENDHPPGESGEYIGELTPEMARSSIVFNHIACMLETLEKRSPIYAGILIGSSSPRDNEGPHHMVIKDGMTWLERAVKNVKPYVDQIVLLGDGKVPESLKEYQVLPDVHDKKGPLSGILAAMRWQPYASWIMMASDMPEITPASIEWLLDQRGPGVRAVLPQLADNSEPEPLFAYYDFRAKSFLEPLECPLPIISRDGVATPIPSISVQDAWTRADE